MDLNQEQAKTLINKISNIEETIGEFWELYNNALVKSEEQMEMDGETNKNISLIASKIKIIEQNSKTDKSDKQLKLTEELVLGSKKNMTDNKEVKEIFKSSFASLNMNIKALRQSFDSDREESGLLKDNPNKKLEGVIGKLSDKINALLKQNGNPKNIKIEKDDEDEGSFLGKLLKWIAIAGIGLAGIGFIWGLIKDNPAVKKFLEEGSRMWNELWQKHIQPKIDWAWNTMVAGLGDLWGMAWEYIKNHPELGLTLVAIGALAVALAPLTGALIALGAVAAGASILLGNFENSLKELEKQTLESWNQAGKIRDSSIADIKTQNLSPEEEAQRINIAKKQEQIDTVVLLQKNIKKEQDELTGWEMPWDDSEERLKRDAEFYEKMRQRLLAEQEKLKKELEKAKEEIKKREIIHKENIPVAPPKNIIDPANLDRTPGKSTYLPGEVPASPGEVPASPGEVPASAGVYKPISSSGIKPNQGPISKENNVAINNEQSKDNPIMINYLASIDKAIKELNGRMDQNTEVNLQGHIANAQATINSVPPPPVINIPKQKLSPNSTRHLANIYTDPNYSLA